MIIFCLFFCFIHISFFWGGMGFPFGASHHVCGGRRRPLLTQALVLRLCDKVFSEKVASALQEVFLNGHECNEVVWPGRGGTGGDAKGRLGCA